MLESLELWARGLVENYGYVGIFLISFSESIVQPIPPDPFIAGGTALGLNPLIASLVAAVASVLGGLTAHTLGKALGEPVARKLLGERNYVKGEALFNRFGVWAVLLAALTPIPFKVVCWLAGIFEMPRIPFLLASFVGRFPRFVAVALLGDYIGGLLK
ncbi:YqaA family protein [Hydrogenivirga sp.]